MKYLNKEECKVRAQELIESGNPKWKGYTKTRLANKMFKFYETEKALAELKKWADEPLTKEQIERMKNPK